MNFIRALGQLLAYFAVVAGEARIYRTLRGRPARRRNRSDWS